MKGTWQGSGTWETTGPGGGGFILVIVMAAAAVSAAEYLLARLWWIIGGTAATAAVLIVTVRLLIRRQQLREAAAYTRQRAYVIDRDVPAAVPSAARREIGPGVTIINNFYGTDEHVAARVIRRALPGEADDITEE